jgi:hypothetical protein
VEHFEDITGFLAKKNGKHERDREISIYSPQGGLKAKGIFLCLCFKIDV